MECSYQQCQDCPKRVLCLANGKTCFGYVADAIKDAFGSQIPVDEIIPLLKPNFEEVVDDEDFPRAITFDALDGSEDVDSVGTIEEARCSPCNWFWYPAHSMEFLLVCDMRYLEWMKKVSNPLSDSNSWDPEPTKEQIEQANKYLERVLGYTFKHWKFEHARVDTDGEGGPLGITLGAYELDGGPLSAIRIWLKGLMGGIARVEYSSRLHEIWLGFVGD